MNSKGWKYTLISIVLILVMSGVASVFVIKASGVNISSEGILSFNSQIALAANATQGNEPLPEGQFPEIKRSGPPIKEVSYNDGLTINCIDELNNFHCSNNDISNYAKSNGILLTEQWLNDLVQKHFEVWIDINEEDLDNLLDNERVETLNNSNYLVVTMCYSNVHIISLEPLNILTKFSGLDSGPITNDWWNKY